MVVLPNPDNAPERDAVHGRKDGSDETNELVEEGDDLSDDEADGGDADDSREPGYPVRWGRGLEVLCAAEKADEDKFGGAVGDDLREKSWLALQGGLSLDYRLTMGPATSPGMAMP